MHGSEGGPEILNFLKETSLFWCYCSMGNTLVSKGITDVGGDPSMFLYTLEVAHYYHLWSSAWKLFFFLFLLFVFCFLVFVGYYHYFLHVGTLILCAGQAWSARKLMVLEAVLNQSLIGTLWINIPDSLSLSQDKFLQSSTPRLSTYCHHLLCSFPSLSHFSIFLWLFLVVNSQKKNLLHLNFISRYAPGETQTPGLWGLSNWKKNFFFSILLAWPLEKYILYIKYYCICLDQSHYINWWFVGLTFKCLKESFRIKKHKESLSWSPLVLLILQKYTNTGFQYLI